MFTWQGRGWWCPGPRRTGSCRASHWSRPGSSRRWSSEASWRRLIFRTVSRTHTFLPLNDCSIVENKTGLKEPTEPKIDLHFYRKHEIFECYINTNCLAFECQGHKAIDKVDYLSRECHWIPCQRIRWYLFKCKSKYKRICCTVGTAPSAQDIFYLIRRNIIVILIPSNCTTLHLELFIKANVYLSS